MEIVSSEQLHQDFHGRHKTCPSVPYVGGQFSTLHFSRTELQSDLALLLYFRVDFFTQTVKKTETFHCMNERGTKQIQYKVDKNVFHNVINYLLLFFFFLKYAQSILAIKLCGFKVTDQRCLLCQINRHQKRLKSYSGYGMKYYITFSC